MRTAVPLNGTSLVQLPTSKASWVIAMLLPMYGDSWAYWLGVTVRRWMASGYSRPITSEATNQTAIVSPSGQSIRVNAAPTSSAAAIPEMTVSTSKARNCAFWSV